MKKENKTNQPTDTSDKIKPKHYSASNGNDVINFAYDNNLSFIEANICKYVVRWKQKNGLEDLLKAKEYLDRLISKELENFQKL